MIDSVEKRAIKIAHDHFVSTGYQVEDVSKKRGHNGYDLLIGKNEIELKIEVKGCTREWQIPDLYFTEFDSEKKLVADYLCVIYFLGAKTPSICLIPRNGIDPENVVEKKGYRLRSAMKNKSVLGKFLVK